MTGHEARRTPGGDGGGCGVVRLAHAASAAATALLLLTGVLRLLAARSDVLERLPGLGFAATLAAHVVPAAVLSAGAAVHLLRRRVCTEPRPRWRLGERRLVHAYLAATLGLLIVTGAVKLLATAGVPLPAALLAVASRLHGLGVVLVLAGAAAYLLARATADEGPLVPSMLASLVDASGRPRRPGPSTDERIGGARPPSSR